MSDIPDKIRHLELEIRILQDQVRALRQDDSERHRYCTCVFPSILATPGDATFLPYQGCLTCDKWLGPVKCR